MRDLKEIEEQAFCLGIINKFADDRIEEDENEKLSFNEFVDALMLKKNFCKNYIEAVVLVANQYEIEDEFWPRLKTTKFGECLMEELCRRRYFGNSEEILLF